MSSSSAVSVYTGVKLRLASILENLLRFARERKDEEQSRFIQDLLADLAEDNFRLAIFGKYNRGKSTLMNALLGMERLPTGVLPLTSVVTTVRHDSQDRVLIQRDGWSLPQEIPLAQLSEYVTENGNPGNEKKVTLAQVFLPSEILRYGFFLIDTPGMGSSILANTKAAEAFIGRADAAIFVMSVESPLDEEELNLLQRAYEQIGKVFVVLNKADLISASEREAIIAAFRERLRALIPEEVPVFVLSARSAIAHIRTDATARDGDLKELIEALLAFMRQEKTGQFMRRMAERVQTLIEAERTLAYLSRQTAPQKESAVARLRVHAQHTERDGAALLASLKQKVQSDTRSSLTPYLSRWQEKVLESLASRDLGDNVNDLAAYLKVRGRFRPEELLQDYSETIKQLKEGLLKLRKADIEPLSYHDDEIPDVNSLGSSASGDVFTGPCTFEWGFRARLLTRFGLGSVPLLQRLLLRPPLVAFSVVVLDRIERALDHRIDLLSNEHKRATEKIVERIIKLYAGLAKSDHEASLRRLSDELEQARRESEEDHKQTDASEREWTVHKERPSKAKCALCDHLTDMQLHFIAQYQYRLAIDPVERLQNAERGGLCAFHTWMYESVSSPQGVCGGYAPVPLHLSASIKDLLKQVKDAPDQLQSAVRNLLRGSRECIVCEVLKTAESERLSQIAVSNEEIQKSTLCLPHLCCAILRDSQSLLADDLLNELAATLHRLGEDMQQFALKQGGLRYSWTSAGERAAHLNALRTIVGAKPLSYIKTVVEI